MTQLEVYAALAIVDGSLEVGIVKPVVLDPERRSLLNEVHGDGAIVHRPLDVVGHVVASPAGVVIVVNPVARAAAVAVGVAEEAEFRIGGIVDASVPFRRHIHVTAPSTLQGVGDCIVVVPFAACERHGQHCHEQKRPECVPFLHSCEAPLLSSRREGSHAGAWALVYTFLLFSTC